MKRKIENIRRQLQGIPRLVAFALAVLLLAGGLFTAMVSLHIVTVVDTDGTRRTLMTTSRAPHEIVRMAGLALSSHDEMTATTGAEGDLTRITIRRAFPVSVAADGVTRTARFVEGTVRDLLAAAGVTLSGDDFAEPALATPLFAGMRVKVRRVTYAEETRREAWTSEEAGAVHSRLQSGVELKVSFSGQYDVTYRDRYVDGALHSSKVLALAPVLTTRPLDSYEFIEGVPCSRIQGYEDITIGADGLPQNYTNVWEGAVCTAYSSRSGRGSSGLGLYCGTAAVNPNVIPYGTRMFVTSADGRFVYGFCIATDTGGAMMEGRVDLDLFFETNDECLQFGKRAMRVYFFG